jgi:hypothetical protein
MPWPFFRVLYDPEDAPLRWEQTKTVLQYPSELVCRFFPISEGLQYRHKGPF